MTTVRYWASARAAVGLESEEYDAANLAELLAAVAARHPSADVARVLTACSYLVDEQPAGRGDRADVSVGPDSVVEVLPPFAGG